MGGAVSDIVAPVVDTATAIFAPEALPFVAPAVGGVMGGISGGPLGALEGAGTSALTGAVGGEIAPVIGQEVGSNIAGNMIANAGLGAITGGATGGNPLMSAAEGAASGGLGGLLRGSDVFGSNAPAPTDAVVAPGATTATAPVQAAGLNPATGSAVPGVTGGVGASGISGPSSAGGDIASTGLGGETSSGLSGPKAAGQTDTGPASVSGNNIPSGSLTPSSTANLTGPDLASLTATPTSDTTIPVGASPTAGPGVTAEAQPNMPASAVQDALAQGVPSLDQVVSGNTGDVTPVGGGSVLSSTPIPGQQTPQNYGGVTGTGHTAPDNFNYPTVQELTAGTSMQNPLTVTSPNAPNAPGTITVNAAAPKTTLAQDIMRGAFGQEPGSTGSKIGSSILSSLPAAAMMGGSALLGTQPVKGTNALNQQAQQLSNQAAAMQSYLQTGQLPPGVQGTVDQAAQAAKTSIKSQYAASGQTGSSAESQALSQVDANAVSQAGTLAMEMFNAGLNEAGMANQLYTTLLQQATGQDTAFSNALSKFATAAAGGSVGAGG